ncbi:DUF3948 family protein [Bacillus cereus]
MKDMKEQVLQVTKGDFVGSAKWSSSINSVNRISIKRISIIEAL